MENNLLIYGYQNWKFAMVTLQKWMQLLIIVFRIQGTTAVELASGLHWYLKYWCGAHISWDKTGGAQLASVPLPGSLPQVKRTVVKIERPVPWNYYQNVVTSSCEFHNFPFFIMFVLLHRPYLLSLQPPAPNPLLYPNHFCQIGDNIILHSEKMISFPFYRVMELVI